MHSSSVRTKGCLEHSKTKVSEMVCFPHIHTYAALLAVTLICNSAKLLRSLYGPLPALWLYNSTTLGRNAMGGVFMLQLAIFAVCFDITCVLCMY